MLDAFKEEAVQRLLTDKDFKEDLEKQVIDAVREEKYYEAHILLKALFEYKERR